MECAPRYTLFVVEKQMLMLVFIFQEWNGVERNMRVYYVISYPNRCKARTNCISKHVIKALINHYTQTICRSVGWASN